MTVLGALPYYIPGTYPVGSGATRVDLKALLFTRVYYCDVDHTSLSPTPTRLRRQYRVVISVLLCIEYTLSRKKGLWERHEEALRKERLPRQVYGLLFPERTRHNCMTLYCLGTSLEIGG